MTTNPEVDTYLIQGCMRCSLGGTPECKVHSWTQELKLLRKIALESGLDEEFKWSQPCYTFKGKNVLIVTAFKDFASMAFFKGVLLDDKAKILTAPGENSQSSRQARFTGVEDILKQEENLREYIQEAIELEKSGAKVEFKKNPEPIPEELEARMSQNPEFKEAFESLTPGRQRGYILFFSQPKQSKTREGRIDKHFGDIMNGKGLHDR